MSAGVRDRGAADALGLVLIAPAVIGLALTVVLLGRSVEGRSEAQAAAESSAQAAVLERSPSAARAAAVRVVDAMLTNADTCGDRDVDVDTDDFGPGGSVSVTITCTHSNRGVEVVPLDPRPYSATATARIDRFRSAEG